MKVGPVFFLAALPGAALAQTQASLGVGVGTVRYAGGSSFSSATLAPAAQFLKPSLFLGASGSLSALPDGIWAEQGRADLWTTGRRLAVSAGGAANGRSLGVESTRFLGAWYTDVLGGAAVDRLRLVASAWATLRLRPPRSSTGAVSAALQAFATPSVSIEVAAGSYLADPFQGLPPGGYVSAGIRLHATPRRLTPPPALAPRLPPLVANRRGDSVVVRFQMAGARSVAIAGDWNAWQPAALRPLAVGSDIWEGAFVLAPGTYHFNLLVDGKEWVVPGGVAVVSDGMGGLVAVLTVL